MTCVPFVSREYDKSKNILALVRSIHGLSLVYCYLYVSDLLDRSHRMYEER